MKKNYYVLPKKMPFKDKMQSMQGNAIEDFLNKSYPPYKDRFEKKEKNKLKVFDGVLLAQAYKKDNEKFYQMLDMFNNKYNLIYQELLARGKFSPKWKSEYELFQLLKKEYTDAIYQYRARWLGHQSLDIFVPSKMLAFEYQGLQHFKPIEVFGGEEHFQRQIKLDKKKRELCIQNDVKLIEWKYDEPISRIFLRKKLKNI